MAEKVCILCNDKFSTRGNGKVCTKCTVFHCETCNKKMKRNLKEIKGNKRFCSRKCSQSSPKTKERIKEKQKELYGGVGFQVRDKWEDLSSEEKERRVSKMRDGYDNYVKDENNVKAMHEKSKSTMIEKYGASSPLHKESSLRKIVDKNRNHKEITRKSQETKANWNTEKKQEVTKKIQSKNKETWENTPDDIKLARAKKISERRKEYFKNMSDKEKQEYKEKQKRTVKKWWDSLSPDEQEKVHENRLRNLNSSNRKFPVISNINKKFAQTINKELGILANFERQVDKYIYDLVIDDLLIDLNPTVSHNSTVSFSHFVGLCSIADCDRHSPVENDYHFLRADEAYKNKSKWLFVYSETNEAAAIRYINYILNPCSLIKVDKNKLNVQKINTDESLEFTKIHSLRLDFSIHGEVFGLYHNDNLITTVDCNLTNDNIIEMKNLILNCNYNFNSDIIEHLIMLISFKFDNVNIDFYDDFNKTAIDFNNFDKFVSQVTYEPECHEITITKKNDLPNIVKLYTAGIKKYKWRDMKWSK